MVIQFKLSNKSGLIIIVFFGFNY